jgi:hypothetical protein
MEQITKLSRDELVKLAVRLMRENEVLHRKLAQARA